MCYYLQTQVGAQVHPHEGIPSHLDQVLAGMEEPRAGTFLEMERGGRLESLSEETLSRG